MSKNGSLKTFQWLLTISVKYRTKLVLAVGLASASAAFVLVPMVCVYLVACELFAAEGAHTNNIRLMVIIAAASVVLRFGLYLIAMALSHISAFNINYDLRSRIASHIALLPMGFFDNTASGVIKKTMGEDVENVELFIGHYVPDAAAAVAFPLLTAAVLFQVDIRLALASLIPVPLAAFMHLGMNRIYKDNVGAYHDNLEKMNNAIVEYVRGMPVIKAFNQTTSSFNRYKNALDTHLDIAKDWNRRANIYAVLFKLSVDLGLLFILPAGFFLLIGGTIDPPVLILFLLIGVGLMEPVNRIIMVSGFLDRIGEGIVRIQAILNQKPFTEPTEVFQLDNYTVEFKNVTFAYNEKNALEDVSLVLREGTMNGFVGLSGAGKSTAAKLIPRFWDINQGEIMIGDRNIQQIPTEVLMNSIAFVFQDAYLMNDTVMENIRMGKTTATDEDIMAAARSAAAHEFIMKLDQGYQTMVGEDGAWLSGGEKQRISIARVILKDAPIIVLDEATAFTDPENESRIHCALNTLIEDKTVIIIAHRLSTIMQADQLLLFEHGRLRNCGSHQELLDDSLYAGMWSTFSRSTDWHLDTKEQRHV